jgi:hypothetical protein
MFCCEYLASGDESPRTDSTRRNKKRNGVFRLSINVFPRWTLGESLRVIPQADANKKSVKNVSLEVHRSKFISKAKIDAF